MPRRDRALPLPTFRPVQRFLRGNAFQGPIQQVPAPTGYREEIIPEPVAPNPRITQDEYRQYVNEATLGQLFGTLPGQPPPKPKPVAKPTGRQMNVRLGDLMKVYSFETGTHKCKLVDFRVPLVGEYILTKNLAEGTKIRKCTMGNIHEPRMIFEVVE